MRKGPSFSPLLLFSLILFAEPLPAAAQDSSFQKSLTAAILVYSHSPAADAGLYNGTVYPGYDHHAQGSPFFLSDSLLTGSVCYAGILYPDTRLSYDLVQQVVIMPDRRQTFEFQLLTEQLSYFTLAGHRFIRMVPDSNTSHPPTAGFYEELYRGKASALARHEKTMQSLGKAEENTSHYRQYDTWYLEVNNRYYPIRNNGNLLDAFDTDRGRVRDFLRKNHVRFKKDPATALIKAAEYYSQSKP